MILKKFWFPYPRCTGNNMYGVRGAKRYKTNVYKDYINECYYTLLSCKKVFKQIKKPVTLALKIFYIPRTNVTKDDDNLLKVVKDVIKHCKLIQDDSQFINTHIMRLHADKENPGVYIEISEWDINESSLIFRDLDLSPEELIRQKQKKDDEDD